MQGVSLRPYRRKMRPSQARHTIQASVDHGLWVSFQAIADARDMSATAMLEEIFRRVIKIEAEKQEAIEKAKLEALDRAGKAGPGVILPTSTDPPGILTRAPSNPTGPVVDNGLQGKPEGREEQEGGVLP